MLCSKKHILKDNEYSYTIRKAQTSLHLVSATCSNQHNDPENIIFLSLTEQAVLCFLSSVSGSGQDLEEGQITSRILPRDSQWGEWISYPVLAGKGAEIHEGHF